MSSISIDYKVTPITFQQFKTKYQHALKPESFEQGYLDYLNINAKTHHYNNTTLFEWYKQQLNQCQS